MGKWLALGMAVLLLGLGSIHSDDTNRSKLAYNEGPGPMIAKNIE